MVNEWSYSFIILSDCSPVALDKVSLFLSKVNPQFLLQISFLFLLLGLCKYRPSNRSFASAFLLLLHLSKQINTKIQQTPPLNLTYLSPAMSFNFSLLHRKTYFIFFQWKWNVLIIAIKIQQILLDYILKNKTCYLQEINLKYKKGNNKRI